MKKSCEHDYEVESRNMHDEDGEAYWDDDGEGQLERVVSICTKCEHAKVEFESTRWGWNQ